MFSTVPENARDTLPDASGLLLAQAFADQCQRWSARAGASDSAIQAVRQAGLNLALAVAEGHACWRLPETPANFPDLLRVSGIVGAAREARAKPLVLEANRLYLARHFDAEQRLATALRTRHQASPPPGKGARRMLREIFPDAAPGDGQKLAVALALCRQLTVVSGGPGTGKTATVARLLACLLSDTPDLRVALAAPTGKAAARLQESLATRARALPLDIAALLPRQATTLHRLLGLRPDNDAALYHARNPLPVDALVVDEASMLDLDLALKLMEALPIRARLVLLGDRNQLQSVEAGSVFSVLSTHASLTAPFRRQIARLLDWPPEILEELPHAGNEDFPLKNAVVWLTRNYRFDAPSPLGRLAAALAAGQAGSAWEAFADVSHDGQEALLHVESLDFPRLLEGFSAYRAALADWETRHRDAVCRPALLFALFQALGAFRVLCAVRQGEQGVEGINARLEKAFADACRPAWRTRQPFHGQPILILKNDPATRLNNGDVGLVLETEGETCVWFSDGREGFLRLPPARLPAWESAFAMTVHKSQGSEFDRIALVLPTRDNPLLTRELIYTAVTRARKGVLLLGNRELFLQAATRVTRRASGLAEALVSASEDPR
ncbi:MAG: exodeoxyribonuclease V subunit alpha [Zoogloeaceae bacterium]|jgi:exodeoxyribonuclease V alpha subunit|nr:exodeoxyribonuclease V subunit alpha [Zoogloeaceae bacterium]